MQTWVIIGVIAAAFIGAAGTAVYFGRKADDLQKVCDAQAERLDDLRKKLADQAVVLSERETELDALRTKADTVKVKYVKVTQSDPAAKSWGETPVPESVSNLLKGEKK